MTSTIHHFMLRQGATVWNTWRAENPREQIDLQGHNLRGIPAMGANLHSANLRNADLKAAHLEEANLQGADLTGADLRGAYLESANLVSANLTGANVLYAHGLYQAPPAVLDAYPMYLLGEIAKEDGRLCLRVSAFRELHNNIYDVSTEQLKTLRFIQESPYRDHFLLSIHYIETAFAIDLAAGRWDYLLT